MKVIVSAPGKVHLMGEHAIVYGKPALLTAINLRMYATLEIHGMQSGKTKIVTLESPTYIESIIDLVQKDLKLASLPKFTLTISSQFPSGFHLGSSAAVAVTTIAALLYGLKKIWNPQRVNELAYEAEKLQHGTPSGGDNTAVTFGGFLWYRKELEFLKSMWQLPFKFPTSLNHFFLINTGKPKQTTGEMVAYVNAKFKVQNEKFNTLFNNNEEQVKRIAVALKENNESELIDALIQGEQTLEAMGVVSGDVKPLMRKIEAQGGAVKILGGGGRQGSVGYLLCYHRNPRAAELLCKPFGYATEQIQLGEEGVRLEKKA